MPKITESWLKKHNACPGGREYAKSTGLTDCAELLAQGLKDDRYSDCQWVIKRVLTHKQLILWAVFSAEQVQHLNPDPRVKAAIDAAKAVAKRNTKANRDAAANAAAYAAAAYAADDAASAAAYAAADAAASAAADAAASAAASAAAYAAAYAAANAAASAAAYAAASAAASAAAYAAIQIKIIQYAIDLIKGEK